MITSSSGSHDNGAQDKQFVAPHVDLPAVLVEVGFTDHPIQGKELAEPTV